MRVHLFLMTAYTITSPDSYLANPTTSTTEHSILHVLHTGNHTALPSEGYKNTSETHGNHTALPSEGYKNTSETYEDHTALPPGGHTNTSERHGSLSKPKIDYNLLDGNAMHITCFSKSGPLPIRYQLFLYNHMLEEKVVNRSEPANFTVPMTPSFGSQVYFNCTAISRTGEKSSNNLTMPVVMDDSAVVVEEAKTDQKDTETGPKHLIPLQHILTSVSPDVLEWNTLVIIICGPIIVFILCIAIVISCLRCQKAPRWKPN